MKKISVFLKYTAFSALIFMVLLSTVAYAGGDSKYNKNRLKKSAADYFVFDINNLYVPLDNKGVLGDVDPGDGAGGKFDGKVFLFSGGFYLSGLDNGDLWSNGVLSASRIEDYQPGPVGSVQTDSKNKMYVVTVNDAAFGTAWQEWKDAVSIGADFYDGDGDGAYNPVDLNNNSIWDSNEDRPDILGDVTAWCVYNDGVPKAQRRWTDVPPKGIEIRQTVFGFNSKGVVGNMLFVRYRIVNKGTIAAKFDSVYFSAAADPDLGDAYDDLVGCDTLISAGYVYNATPDATFGANCPTFLIDFFQGPIVYIPGVTFTDANGNGTFDAGETPLTYAFNTRGKVLGRDTIPGAKNIPLTSFTQYMQSHPTHGDPNTKTEGRNYMLGGVGKAGDAVSPCAWAFGTVYAPVLCADVNPKYMYSGNPVPAAGATTGTGWINTTPIDQRQMSNTGPFVLEVGKPIDIVIAYVVGRDPTTSVKSVQVAKDYDQVAQMVFDANFPAPPPPPPVSYTTQTGDGFINLDFQTAAHLNYVAVDTVLVIYRKAQGFYLTSYRTNSKANSIAGVENSKEVSNYSFKNKIQNIYQMKGNGGIDLVRPVATDTKLLDTLVYADNKTGRIRFTLKEDPFTGGPLVKGKEYYFAITAYTLNYEAISRRDGSTSSTPGDYIDSTGSAYEEFETPVIRVVYGSNMYSPGIAPNTSVQTSGKSKGAVKFIVVNNDSLTGDNYQVEFSPDYSVKTSWLPTWSLINTTNSDTLVKNSKNYNFDTTDYSGKVYEGIIPKVKSITPAYMGIEAQYAAYKFAAGVNQPAWTEFLPARNTGAYYAGADVSGPGFPTIFGSGRSVIRADKLRSIEVRFGGPNFGKAYRYLNGFIGSAITKLTSYVYAGGVAAADTVGDGPVGMVGEGFVDVPFQVWVKDTVYGEEKQLAVGFIERSYKQKGVPDGVWDPGTSVDTTRELIVVFDALYDAAGSQKLYTGGFDLTATTKVWADVVKGYTIPAGVVGTGVVTAADSVAAKSPLFNSMWVLGLDKRKADTTFVSGDKWNVNITTYPYTSSDKFTFSTKTKGELTSSEQKDLFGRVNVFPNPLFAYNPATSYDANLNADDPFVTFSNLPDEVTIKIYSLSGTLVRTLTQYDKLDGVKAPYLRWNIQNEAGLRVASGMYIAIVTSPKYGEKILKFGVIMPQKQLPRY